MEPASQISLRTHHVGMCQEWPQCCWSCLGQGDGLPNPLRWMEVGIMVDCKHFFYTLTRKWVRKDPYTDPNSTGLSKTRLCQVFHVALNLLSSMCSPPSLLYALHPPQLWCTQICRWSSRESSKLCHSADGRALPPSGGEGWGTYSGWMLLRLLAGNFEQEELVRK